MKSAEVLIIGSGMAGLTTACLLAKDGYSVTVLEQNWLPGGCSSSYPRKHYIFESGATTLVGLDQGMPLRHLLSETGIEIAPVKLEVPMKVYLKNGEEITRFQDLELWIEEAERVFGKAGQRAFWTYCYKISQLVWQTSLQQKVFPPASFKDLVHAAKNFRPRQLGFARLAFFSMEDLLKKYGLHEHQLFREFVNEQLLITAQNYLEEVNVLFGATALCYTNYGNYYMPGGLLNLVKPLVSYIEQNGGEVLLRTGVKKIENQENGYLVHTKDRTFSTTRLVSAIPINDTLDLWDEAPFARKYQSKLLASGDLNSAFSLGFVMKKRHAPACLHHQIHLDNPLPYAGSHSIFLSLSHPDDQDRCGPDELVGSVSTHIPNPAETIIENKAEVEEAIFAALEKHGLLKREDLIFHHASTPKAWKKWTGRKWGFVGGYPQFMKIKPWQMIEARLDHRGAYLCGDSTYP
ncbi:MAG: NAD(P)/FAD-dependent oxidoreductase, partial [Bacteroidota bacterium]